jgi:hypothetical protein
LHQVQYKRMKTLIFFLSFFFFASASYAQKQYLSYEDLKYMIENNLGKTDTFLVAKGYTITKMDKKKNTRTFSIKFAGGTKSEVSLRADGKKIYVEIDSNEPSQYNMINNSVGAFVIKTATEQDITTLIVKDLGTLYIRVSDPVPYDPIRKDVDIHLVADRSITSYN